MLDKIETSKSRKKLVSPLLRTNNNIMKTIFKSLAVAVVVLLCLSTMALAQTSASNEPVRPSADAWAGVQYGAVSPSLYTGTLHLSVPLYTYKDPDFEIPISAEYATNGCLPNDKAGILGVGWSLNAGGSITREVRGIPDDKRLSRDISASHVNYVNGFGLFYDSSLTRSDMYGMPVCGLGFTGRSCVYYRFSGQSGFYTYSFYDAEPDVFHFNFMGYSGSFHLDFGGVVRVYDTNVPPDSFRIETGFSSYGENSPIAIVTGDGYRYEFDGYYGHSDDNTEVTYDSGSGVILTWKLSRIVAPNGRVAEFGYTRGAEVRTLRPNTLCYNLGINAPGYTDSEQFVNEKAYSDTQLITADLTSVAIDGETIISMTYDHPTEKSYLNANENANQSLTAYGNDRLKTLTVSKGGNTIRSCSFTFDNNNPAQRNFLTGIAISGEGTYSMQYQNTTSIPMYCTFKVDHWGYYNGQTGPGFLSVSTLSSDYMDETLTASSIRAPNATYAKYGTLSRITYPTGGYSTFTYEAHTYGKVMRRLSNYDFWPQAATESGTAGGVRIKKVQHYDANGTSLDWHEYNYTEGSANTGILIWVPRYKIQYSATNPAGVEEFGTMKSNNLSHYGSTHIEYAAVTESRPDGSSIKHRYTSSLDYEDGLYYENGDAEKYIYITNNGIPALFSWYDTMADICKIFILSSRQSLRGREKAVEMLNSSGTTVASTATTYTDVLPNQDWDYSPQYLLHYTYDVGTYIGREDVGTHTESRTYGSQTVSATTSYTYNGFAQRLSQTVNGSRGEQQVTRWTYVSDYATAATTNMYRKMYDAGQIDRPVEEAVYTKAPGGSETLLNKRTWAYLRPDAVNHPDLFCVASVTEHDGQTNLDYVTTYAYSKAGRILQKTDPDGRTTVYVWGYGGLYPVAEVTGATLAQVKAVSGLSGIENAPLSGALSSAQASALRAISGAEATTWEYSPLVGLTKETTSDGRATTYTYNATGKLHQVLDDLGRKTGAYLYSTDNRQ